MTSGTGAAVTATPSYSILAAPGYGTGGSWATTLGGEVPVANTGLTSGTNWIDRAKDIYQNVNRAQQFTKGQQQQQGGRPQEMLHNDALDLLRQRQREQTNNTPSATEIFNGVNLRTDQNVTQDFTHGGTFGGFN
ncbi:hypothetical protein CTP45_07800 [Salmonella enterica]|nr:hypothetical protein [Salmonella enterica]ECG6430190.1 hypothetical protein [Salmonella enterica subsp. enterica serovar Saintpaul]EDW0017489.1 hypothetical protein [Salmonella enterica subsp. enterica serovar Aba]EAW8023111.1 hypothetical protein [Salmonella enterica]EBA1053862.1 hypothetical protein [Salmonella enterica]